MRQVPLPSGTLATPFLLSVLVRSPLHFGGGFFVSVPSYNSSGNRN